MIFTITLNPALDRHLFLPELDYTKAMFCPTVDVFAGGKGVNVSRTVKLLGGDTMASGFIGGHTGERLLLLLHGEGIACDFIRIERETRTCTFIHEIKTGRELKINTPGPLITATDLGCLIERIESWATPKSIAVISGSVPEGIPNDIYFKLVERLKRMGMLTLVDTNGNNLQQALEAKPYLICPNNTELAKHADLEDFDIEGFVEASLRIAGHDAYIVITTLGEGGLIVANEGKVLRFIPPYVKTVDSTGAGDAVMGALAYCFEKDYDIWDAARFATACATASVLMRGGGNFNNNDLRSVIKEITVIRLV